MRTAVAVLAALLIAVQVVRNSAVLAIASKRPADAARMWSGHPASEISIAMRDIARASRAGRPAPVSAFALIADAAEKAPLAPEPFLVRGVQADLAGDVSTAQRAFEAAQWRDPRSLVAASFLADSYFRSGNVSGCLREVAALARLSQDGVAAAVPYLAQYAADRAKWPPLRQLFRADPRLARPVLVALASDISTVPAALALADLREAGAPQWLAPMVDTLIKAGDYARARAIWSRAARPGTQAGEPLYDAGFRDAIAPPPFNWQLTRSTLGLAERQPGGKLHLLFYGDDDGTLASQLLLLQQGAYRLSMKLAGDAARAHSLTWSIWCDKAPRPFSSITLDTAAAHGWQFHVPAACQAQWLKLSGVSADLPQQTDVSITDLSLAKAAPRA